MKHLRPFFLVFGTLLIGVPLYLAVINLCGIVKKEPWMTLALVGSFAAAWYFCLRLWRRPAEIRMTITEEMLRDQGLLEVQECKVRRSFGIEEFEDEGPSYFVELEDGRLLFLNGQYLWDYEEQTGVPAKFPCSHFRVKCDKNSAGVFDLELLSPHVPPEEFFPPFTRKDFDADIVPEDGAIVPGTYEEWKRRIEGRKRP